MIAASATVETSREAPSLSVIIPVYNSEAILPALIARLEPVLHALTRQFEVILVNDGSRDGSWEVISRLEREHHWIRGIDLMRNYGQHNALLCGIRTATSDQIVTMDDDLQHPPEDLPRLLARLAEGYDVVYGAPIQEQHGLWRNLASQTTKWALQSAMGAEAARQISAYRAFRTELREAFANVPGRYFSLDVVLTWGTSRFGVVPVSHDRRLIGNSNYTFGKLLTHALNLILGLSTLPLKVATVIGFGCVLSGILLLAYILGHYLIVGRGVSDFAFLALAISLLSGAQLLTLGMIGEYLARMRFGIMERPPFTVRSNRALKPCAQPATREQSPMEAEGPCEYLEWDSAFFGCDIARLIKPRLDLQLCEVVEAWCRSRDIDCLYFLCDSYDLLSIRTAEQHGFRLVDERLTLVHDLQNLPADITEVPSGRVRLWTPEDLPSLRAIARKSHVDSRFYHDGYFSPSRCDALYEAWIEKSCHGACEAVLVAELDSRAVGYVTCVRTGPSAGQIGLLAVDPAARGQGLGRSLIQHALRWFAGQGLTQITVVTQGRNSLSQRQYTKCGFVLHLAQNWYHRWFSAEEVRIAG